MIRRSEERNVETKANLFCGLGEVTVRHLLNGPDEMYGKGRVFAHTTLAPGSSIGFHMHENECEVYYIYRGTAEFDDNGEVTVLYAGDVAVTRAGEGHGINNIGVESLEIIALILYR
ncbi:MAG: cupin domain-containing protein [Firmicutes bacterium]|jgi:mannose-6-phosphate isomerase-like protein (cupin superfamily)|nr:cupin domain-containing protein [Bacillota bacterium]NLL87746.1 cupin domain-containing protein [Bacillota bacterium]